MAEYDKGFADQVLIDLSSEDSTISKFTFDIEPSGFKMPPVLEVIRFMSEWDKPEAQEKNCRWCLMDRTVKIKVDGEQVGTGFVFNDMNAPWDIYPEIKAYPLALQELMEITGAFVLKNSTPLQKKNPVATAKTGT